MIGFTTPEQSLNLAVMGFRPQTVVLAWEKSRAGGLMIPGPVEKDGIIPTYRLVVGPDNPEGKDLIPIFMAEDLANCLPYSLHLLGATYLLRLYRRLGYWVVEYQTFSKQDNFRFTPPTIYTTSHPDLCGVLYYAIMDLKKRQYI